LGGGPLRRLPLARPRVATTTDKTNQSRDGRSFERIMKTLNSKRADQVFTATMAAMIDIRSQSNAPLEVFGLVDVIAALMARDSRDWESKPAEIGPEDFDPSGK
jgi:hypothetical protein